MTNLPWRTGQSDDGDPHAADVDVDPIVSCEFQDGTLVVYAERVHIVRPSRSKFSDKWIDADRIRGVTYSKRLVISYIQIEEVDFDHSDERFLTTPVDENTLHFGRGKRECARRARDAIRERTSAN